MLVIDSTYTIAEAEAPEGYDRVSEEASFTMNDQGVLKLIQDASGAVKIENNTLVMTDSKTPEVPVVDTGDQTHVRENAVALFLSLLCIFAALFYRRRHEEA
jgi:hypothetical protein